MKEQKNNSDNSKDLWNPNSWRNFPISQQPEYSDPLQVEHITDKVRKIIKLI
jgi:3-deoxy-D-arabino-heptulosonate 7-phosphate (DAHP) synthase class II